MFFQSIGMNGVFDWVKEFHIFKGGKSASLGADGCCHGGCCRVVLAMAFAEYQYGLSNGLESCLGLLHSNGGDLRCI